MMTNKSLTLLASYLETYQLPPIKEVQHEDQNAEYEGMSFQLQQHSFRSRLAKKTPTKKGYFVVFWEKDESNTNQAFSYQNSPGSLLVFVIDGELEGVFTFPKEVLRQQGILQTDSQKGKMGMRVYPSWVTDLNPSAKKTQNWQTLYFTETTSDWSHSPLYEVLLNTKKG